MMNSCDPAKSQQCSTLPPELFSHGKKRDVFLPSEQEVVRDDIKNHHSSHSSIILPPIQQFPKEAFVTPEYQPTIKKKIFKDKLSSSNLNILPMKSSQTLDLDSTSKEKVSITSSSQSKQTESKKLSSLTKTDCVVSDSSLLSNSLKRQEEYLQSLKMKLLLQNRNSSKTSFPLSPVSPLDCMDSEVMESKMPSPKASNPKTPFSPFWNKECLELKKQWPEPTEEKEMITILSSDHNIPSRMGSSWFSIQKSEVVLMGHCPEIKVLRENPIIQLLNSNIKYKTLRFKLHLTPQQKKLLDRYFEIQRWYYNLTVEMYISHTSVFENIGKSKPEKKEVKDTLDSVSNVRDIMLFLEAEETKDNVICSLGSMRALTQYQPSFIPEKGIGRVIRGAFERFESNLKSAQSNRHKNPVFAFSSNKDNHLLRFEDGSFPVALKRIEGSYGFRTAKSKKNSRKRRTFKISEGREIKKGNKSLFDVGCEFYHDLLTDTYFLHQPVPTSFYPPGDHRENQAIVKPNLGLISLDPGVRTILTGINPSTGEKTIVGEGSTSRIKSLFKRIDSLKPDKDMLPLEIEEIHLKRRKIWSKIKNMVSDLHWKTASYLSKNHRDVLLGDIRVSKIVTGSKTSKTNNRMLKQLSFYKFKTKLAFKCKQNGSRLYLVHEANTTKTCHKCGTMKDIGASKVYQCENVKCKMVYDRDLNSAYNIAYRGILAR